VHIPTLNPHVKPTICLLKCHSRVKHVGSSCDANSNFRVFCDDYECFYYPLYASNFKRDINNVHRNALIEFVHGWEVYTSLSLDLCYTYVCCDAHICCTSSTSSQTICDGTNLKPRPYQTGS
jgi:hypothetical protein